MAQNTDNMQIFRLHVEDELRILVGENSDVKVQLSKGLAEIFGSPMELNREYILPAYSSIAILTFQGCRIKVSGQPEAADVVRNTDLILQTVLHANLEERRIQAGALNKLGPVILVVGPNNVGKSTLCRMLLNYAARMNRRPVFVDLDVGQNSICIPGSIGVITVNKPVDIEFGFDDHSAHVYEFGHTSPGHNILLYFLLVKTLGEKLRSDMRKSIPLPSSGVIINTCGWIRGHGYDAITRIAMSFEIDVLCVMEEERLYSRLRRDMPTCVKVFFYPKLDGAVERTRPVRFQSRKARVKEYFYGSTNQLTIHTFEVKYSDIQVFKIITRCVREDEQYLGDVTLNDTELESVPLGYNLVDEVLGLSTVDSFRQDLILMPILGFICILDVDIARDTVTVLSPQPSPLPKKILLMGDIKLKE